MTKNCKIEQKESKIEKFTLPLIKKTVLEVFKTGPSFHRK